MSLFTGKSLLETSLPCYRCICVGLILLYRTDMVLAEENLTMTLAVASSVAVFMFAVLIGVIIVGITCNRWFDKYQSRLGRGKVPRIAGFWKKKKKVHHSMASRNAKAELNHYNSVIIPTSNTRNSHTDTWIKKWANDTRQYEEVSKEIQLDDEGGFDEVPLTDVAALTTDSARNTIQSEETGEMSIPSTGSTVIANHVTASPQTEDAEEKAEGDKDNPNTESLPANGDIDVVIL